MKYFLVSVLILVFAAICCGQEKKFKVHIILSGDSSFQPELKDFLSRDISSLPDVEITSDGEIVLYVAGIANQLNDGTVLGYTLNAIYLQPMLRSTDKTIVPIFLDSSLFFGGKEDLEKLSKNLVDDFTVKILETRRRLPPKRK